MGREQLFLQRGDERIPLQVLAQDKPRADIMRYGCRVPTGIRRGLYDLLLESREQTLASPNAVCVMREVGDTVTLLHTSDWHMLAVGAADVLVDNSALIRALVSRINALQPDMAICTGDVVSRYGVNKEVLSAEQIAWQASRAREIALQLDVPLFVIPGNHDVAFASSRSVWRDHMGWPWDRTTEDHSLDLGDAHLAFLDGFAHYDEANALITRGHTPEQIGWLREDMRKAARSRWRFLFIHYDYDRQLLPILGELGVHMLFYGHSDVGFADELRGQGVLDGHLLGSEAYRLVRVAGEGVSSETVSWADLIDAHA